MKVGSRVRISKDSLRHEPGSKGTIIDERGEKLIMRLVELDEGLAVWVFDYEIEEIKN